MAKDDELSRKEEERLRKALKSKAVEAPAKPTQEKLDDILNRAKGEDS